MYQFSRGYKLDEQFSQPVLHGSGQWKCKSLLDFTDGGLIDSRLGIAENHRSVCKDPVDELISIHVPQVCTVSVINVDGIRARDVILRAFRLGRAPGDNFKSLTK